MNESQETEKGNATSPQAKHITAENLPGEKQTNNRFAFLLPLFSEWVRMMPDIFTQSRSRSTMALTLGMVSALPEELAYSFAFKRRVTRGCYSTIPFWVVSSGRRKRKTFKDKYVCQESKRCHDVLTQWLKQYSVTGSSRLWNNPLIKPRNTEHPKSRWFTIHLAYVSQVNFLDLQGLAWN